MELDRGGQAFELDLLGQSCLVELPDCEARIVETGQRPPIWHEIVLVHYLAAQGPAREDGELITFAQVPSGMFFRAAFDELATNRLVAELGDQPELLRRGAAALGGRPAEVGDFSVVLPVLPKVPVVLQIWQGDDELPPLGGVLFRDDVSSFLCTEDIAVIAGMTVQAIVRAARRSG